MYYEIMSQKKVNFIRKNKPKLSPIVQAKQLNECLPKGSGENMKKLKKQETQKQR
jgi:hypothetical protein